MMLGSGDQGDGHTFIGAEAGAPDRRIFDLAGRRSAKRPDPTSKLGDGAFRVRWPERHRIGIPAAFPAGDVAGLVAGEPASEADAHQPLGPERIRPAQCRHAAPRRSRLNFVSSAHLTPSRTRPGIKMDFVHELDWLLAR